MELASLIASDGALIHTVGVIPWWKDYDEQSAERPSSLPSYIDVSPWFVLTAMREAICVGGAIVGVHSRGFDFPGLNEHTAVLVDIRVVPACRRLGIGSSLLRKAVELCFEMGKAAVLVETQDINAPACRIYSELGFRLKSCDPHGYGTNFKEARLIWQLNRRV